MSGVRVEGLTVGYGGKPILKDLSFSLESPFFLVVMGPNGAGKSTLLRTLVGVLKPYSGSVRVYGLDPWRRRREVRSVAAYVPQLMNIREEVPVTVEEIVAMGLLSKLPPPRLISTRVKELVREVLALVDMAGYERKFFNQLSGGQQKRVLIASALIRRPKALILDEPGSMLDFKARCELMQLIEKIHVRRGTDVIMTSHEIPSCMTLEPDLLLLNRATYAFGKINEVLRREILVKIYPGMTEREGLLILGEDHVKR
ncbi:MAG: metal ABC transporter ATP-binding protein [Desulfurococcales archaeon]|nr:metal ABC transporter ATP-binding protein [Desulfurococcales archaeon]